ncbi:alpha/beta hydrolase [uncultured Draconibacterium sp.]|uniref:alpha/beta fold hydrolase n=1 Tax=uncultured Draconibacterium sp. TaxID=1573823 RepID=UPI0025EBF66E|nr:alpha/beta hydrolase [uncultured Draconibacterium sp.]
MSSFQFRGLTVNYDIKGEGEPVLLLQGNTASSGMFAPVIEEYANNFKVITIDFPGHGKSDRLEQFETDFWYYNAMVCLALLDETNTEKVTVIGTSGGALVALNMGLEAPARIKAIVADSFEGAYPLNTFINDLKTDREEAKRNSDAVAFWQHNHGEDWEKIVDLDTDMLLRFAERGHSFFHKPIAELSVPTWLTGSREDEYCDYLEDIYLDLQKKNRRLKIYLFEKGGHPAMLSNHEQFLGLVRQWIVKL